MGDRAGSLEGMDNIAERFRALRKAMKLTQEELARRANPEWAHVYAARVERGENKLTSRATKTAFAAAFGLTPTDLEDYLTGKMSLREATERAKAHLSAPLAAPQGPPLPALPQVPPAPAGVPESRQALVDSTLGMAFLPERHAVPDLFATREILLAIPVETLPAADLVTLVGRWLDAAKALRDEGRPVTLETLALKATLVNTA